MIEVGDELPEGSHQITYEFTPVGGTVSDRSDTLDITIDTTPPNITSGDAVSILDEGGANQIVYTATSVDDSQVTYDLDDGDKSNYYQSNVWCRSSHCRAKLRIKK